MVDKELDAGSHIGHYPCIANEVEGKRESLKGNNLPLLFIM